VRRAAAERALPVVRRAQQRVYAQHDGAQCKHKLSKWTPPCGPGSSSMAERMRRASRALALVSLK
jgi:hypothetical protein